jgi:hypothetical protein
MLPIYEVYKGENISMSFTATLDGAPYNLTGKTVQGVMRSSISGDVILDLSPTIPTPANGVIIINVSTSSIPAGIYGADVQISTSTVPVVIHQWTQKIRPKYTPNL